jgi:hypothetical protein
MNLSKLSPRRHELRRRRILKRALPKLLAALARKRTRRPVVLVKPTFE